MTLNKSKEALLKEGLIKKTTVDFHALLNLIKRVFADLETAKRNLNKDSECAYSYSYRAILRAGLALMSSQGYMPDLKDKDFVVLRFASSFFGDEHKTLLSNYEIMRNKVYHFIYEPETPCTTEEAKIALLTAKEMVDIIHAFIKAENPQLQFNT